MKFLNKILFHIVESHTMKNNKIGILLDTAKKNERQRVTDDLNTTFELKKLKMQENFDFEMSEKDSQLRQLYLEIKDLKDRGEEVETLYHKTMQRARKNLNITTTLLYHVNKIQQNSIESYQAIQTMVKEADDHKVLIEKEKQMDLETFRLKTVGMLTE